jgi:hypothetical protein
MRVLAFLFGVILLLPGLCSLGFMAIYHDPSDLASSPIVLLWLVCFGVSFGGIMMIRYALRGRAPPRNYENRKDS